MATARLSRRTVLGALAAAGAGTLVPATPARAAAPLVVPLPRPTGPYRVGMVPLHLVDPARHDPWVPSHPVRELMVSLWYPARDTGRYPVAPWLPPAAWDLYQQNNAIPPGVLAVPMTHGHVDAPVDRGGRPRPVVLFSPGSGGDRDSSTNQVEELVSYGYTVVTIDHTHDSAEVEFPDGHVEGNTIPPDTIEINTEATRVRAADTRFVLDRLCAINAGHSPDAEHRPLPAGIAGTLDVDRVGMFGHSMGGATTAWAMLDDRRILAGINLDGAFYGPVVDAGLDRPFLLMSSQDHNRDDDDTWAGLWSHLRGWRRDLRLLNSGHLSYNDVEILLPPAAGPIGYPPEVVSQFLGTIDPVRAVLVVRTYLRGFMDLYLRHRGTDLFDGPSPRYPEIQFVP